MKIRNKEIAVSINALNVIVGASSAMAFIRPCLQTVKELKRLVQQYTDERNILVEKMASHYKELNKEEMPRGLLSTISKKMDDEGNSIIKSMVSLDEEEVELEDKFRLTMNDEQLEKLFSTGAFTWETVAQAGEVLVVKEPEQKEKD